MGGKNEKNRRESAGTVKDNLHTFELITTTQVPDAILCKYCKWQLPPVKTDGRTLERYTNAYCKKYPLGKSAGKPDGVLWGYSVDCRYFSPLDSAEVNDGFFEFLTDFDGDEVASLIDRIESAEE